MVYGKGAAADVATGADVVKKKSAGMSLPPIEGKALCD